MKQLDEPIAVWPTMDDSGYVLYDEYCRDIIARQLEWMIVPVEA